MATEDVVAAARNAKESGATRFCMGAAWRAPNDRQVEQVAEHVAAVAELGLETCVTLGMLTPEQMKQLDAALAAAETAFTRLDGEIVRAQQAWERSLDRSAALPWGPSRGLVAHYPFDGSLDAGPAPGGGYRVHARLPTAAAAR